MSQTEYAERRARAELQVTQAELEKCKSQMEHLNAQIEEMGERFGDMLDQEATVLVAVCNVCCVILCGPRNNTYNIFLQSHERKYVRISVKELFDWQSTSIM